MLKKAAALFLITAGVMSGVGCQGNHSRYVYVALSGANEVAVYREDPYSGVLTQLSTSPYPAGNGSRSVVIHPSGKFLYVANSADNTISLFDVAANGGITEVTPRTNSGTTPAILTVDSAGAFLYEADWGSNSITVYSIDSSKGALTQTANFGVGGRPLNMAVNSAGNVLYVALSSSPEGVILAFSMNAGKLSSTNPVLGSFSTGGLNPYGLFVDSSGNYLYVTNGAPDNSIAEFTIGSTGLLTPINGSPIGQSEVDPLSVVVDPSGKYLFVANEGSSNISAYGIASGGSVNALVTPTFTTSSQPNFLLADPGGKYLLVSSQSGNIQVFGLDSTNGDLTAIGTYSTGSNPTSLAITH